MKQYCS